jgi:hypothetical protein
VILRAHPSTTCDGDTVALEQVLAVDQVRAVDELLVRQESADSGEGER